MRRLAVIICALLFSFTDAKALEKDVTKISGMQWVSDDCIKTTHQNEMVVVVAINEYLKRKNLQEIKVLRSRRPFANPQNPCRVHIGFEITSLGAERMDGDHFADMLLRYTPGIHIHSYLTATVLSDLEPLTADEAQEFVDRWIARNEPVMVYERGPNVPDEEITVCRVTLDQYQLSPDSIKKNCETIASIRQGKW